MDRQIYQEEIIERYKRPRNKGEIKDGVVAEEANFLCGDRLRIGIKMDKQGKIVLDKFEGGGCAVSMAAVDMFLDRIIGITISEAKKITGKEIEKMLGVELSMSRKKCAYLGLEVLRKIKTGDE